MSIHHSCSGSTLSHTFKKPHDGTFIVKGEAVYTTSMRTVPAVDIAGDISVVPFQHTMHELASQVEGYFPQKTYHFSDIIRLVETR